MTMTFGLLDGWWAFSDPELRLPDAPVVSPDGWRRVLPTAGFNEPAVLGWNDPPETSFQCLFVAAKVGEPAADAPRAAPAPAATIVVAPAIGARNRTARTCGRGWLKYLGGLLGAGSRSWLDFRFDRSRCRSSASIPSSCRSTWRS